MKKTIIAFLALIACVVLFSACNSGNSYAKDLEAEKELIQDFIKRQQINIIDTVPTGEWGEKDFLEIDDNLYFHLSVLGDTAGTAVTLNDKIRMRYRRYTLNAYADTTSYWTTNDSPYPNEFRYGVTSSAACTAWHQAIGYMKYSGSQATIICPSKLGFEADQTAVIPYGYDLKIQIQKY